jgi:hypothetical protein
MGQIHKFDRRREFLKAFSESPSEILQALIASQAQQLKVSHHYSISDHIILLHYYVLMLLKMI